MEAVIQRVQRILLEPNQAWQEIKEEEKSASEIARSYLMYLVTIPAMAHFLGQVLFASPRASFLGGIVMAVVLYVLIFVAIVLATLIINSLASEFGAEKNENAAFKVVAYSATAPLIASVFFLIPALSALAILGFYGVYLLLLGLPKLMGCMAEKALSYTIVTVVIMAILGALAFGIANLFTCR